MSNTRWPILTLTLPRTATAAQWDLFTTRVIEEAGCLGIEELGPPDRIGPPDRARLFYSDEKGELPDARGVQSLAAECFACDIELPALDLVPDQDWGQNWRQYFRTTRVTGNLYVGPPWEGLPADAPANARHVRIEPGQAFGTGTHATTRLCLRMIEGAAKRGAVLLDVGAGSGILGIAAVKLGFSHAICLENDPVCEENLLHNAVLNGVAGKVHWLHGSRPRMAFEAGLIMGVPSPDLIVCNMLSHEFEPLLNELHSLRRPLILSGFLVAEEASVASFAKAEGWTVAKRDTEDEWGAFLLNP
jgi:ribosomal protein L11 methyltransferase